MSIGSILDSIGGRPLVHLHDSPCHFRCRCREARASLSRWPREGPDRARHRPGRRSAGGPETRSTLIEATAGNTGIGLALVAVGRGRSVPTRRTSVEPIGGSRAPAVFDPTVVDEVMVVSDEESLAIARRLRADGGLLVGGSAALRVAARARPDDGPVVALLPTGGTGTAHNLGWASSAR